MIDQLRNNVILVSTSSRQVEIDMETFYMRQSKPTELGSIGRCSLKIPAVKKFSYSIKAGEKNVTVYMMVIQ